MIFDKLFFDNLLKEAADSERLRVAYDLRNSDNDGSQRMLNALMPGTIVPIHRHKETNETIVVLKGSLEQFIYNDKGGIIEQHIFEANSSKCGMLIPAGCWHNIKVLEPTIILETKEGKYRPVSKDDIMQ